MGERGKRPFWMHQLVEYLLGGALVATGLQSPTPLVPSVVGGIIAVHAAATKGGLAAFQAIGRRLHRSIDLGIIALELVAALQQAVDIDGGTRVIMVGIAVVHAFVWWQSSYAGKQTRRERAAAAEPVALDGRSADIGRTAGRALGNGVNAVRRKAAERNRRR